MENLEMWDVKINSVRDQYLTTILNEFFELSFIPQTFESIQKAIDNGTQIIGNISVSSGSNHMVRVVGYLGDTKKLIVTDTRGNTKGNRLMEISASELIQFFGITKIK